MVTVSGKALITFSVEYDETKRTPEEVMAEIAEKSDYQLEFSSKEGSIRVKDTTLEEVSVM